MKSIYLESIKEKKPNQQKIDELENDIIIKKININNNLQLSTELIDPIYKDLYLLYSLI